MSERTFSRRRIIALSAIAVAVLTAVVVWAANRGPREKVDADISAGAPIEVPGGVHFIPAKGGGFAVHLGDGQVAKDLKAGKKVIIAGPTGGTIEAQAIEPTPPQPRVK
jgi:hypothetical protein